MGFFFNEEHRISQHGYPISEKETKSGIHGFKGTVYLTIIVNNRSFFDTSEKYSICIFELLSCMLKFY